MHKRKKIIIFAASIIVITLALFFLLRKEIAFHHESAFKSIPEDVDYVVQIHNILLLKDLVKQHRIFHFLSKNDEINQHLSAFIQLTDALIGSDETAELSMNYSLLISYSSEYNDYLFSCLLTSDIYFSDFVKITNKIGDSFGYKSYEERKGENILTLSDGQDSLFAALTGNILTFSKSKSLVLSSLSAAESEIQGKWSSFAAHKKTKNEYFAIFSKNGFLASFLEKYFYENSMFPFSLIPDSGSIAFVFSQSEMNVLISGNNIAVQPYVDFDFKYAKNWKRAFDDIAMSAIVSTSEFQLPDDVKSILGKTAYELLFLPQYNETIATSVLLLKVTDTLAFTKYMHPLSLNITENLIKNYYFQDYTVRRLKNETMFTHNQFVHRLLPDYRYFCLVDNVAILASTPDVLEKVLHRYSEFHMQSQNNMMNQDKLLLKIHLPLYYPFLLASAKPENVEKLELIYPFLSAFRNIEFSIFEGKSNVLNVEIDFDEDGGTGFLKDFTDKMIQQVLFRNENMFEVLLSFPELAYDGQADGKHTFYFADSTVSAHGAYLGGLASGTWRFFYEDGTYQASVEFMNGEAHGRAVFYRHRPIGRMLVSCTFENNLLNGKYVEFHKNGNPKLSVLFNKNKMNGKLRAFYPSGIIMSEAEMKFSNRISDYLLYASSGDFLDPTYLTTTSYILSNYRAFLVANSVVFLNNTP